MRGDDVGPLHGVPFAVKDLVPTEGIRTTWGSLIFKDHVPDADSVAVARSWADGDTGPGVALWARLADQGYGFTGGPADKSWLWREAELFDPAGNRVLLYWAGENRLNPPWRVDAAAV